MYFVYDKHMTLLLSKAKFLYSEDFIPKGIYGHFGIRSIGGIHICKPNFDMTNRFEI